MHNQFTRISRLFITFTLFLLFSTLCLTLSQDEPVSGGNLVYVHQQLATSLDANVWTATNAARIMRQIYDPLVWQPEGGVFVPGLAREWEISDDGTEYTFWLREDVTFHDGTPFNAEAVKATFDRMVDPETRSLQVARLGPYERADVIDEFTVRIVLSEPFNLFLSNLSEVALAPASPTAVATLGDEYSLNPVATGPFRVRGWDDETTLVLERNPDYTWGPDFLNNQGPAYLDTITYRFVEESATRLIAAETGEADIMDAPPAQDIGRLESSGNYQIDGFVVPGMPQILNVNITVPPTNELAVRRAVMHAVDREALAALLFFGTHPAGQGPLSSGSWAYWPGLEEMYPYDPELAEQLLDEAGWVMNSQTGIREKDGVPLRIRHVTSTGGDNQRVSEFFQASVRDVGIDWVVDIMQYEATVVRYAANDYEAARLAYALIDPHDAFFLAYHSSQIDGGGQFNRTRLADPEFDELIERALDETDVETRMELYRQLQEWVMEEVYIWPAYELTLFHVLQDHVNDFKVDLLGRPYMVDVWMDR
jgi:peptide/nickel transport system substrate-binding protein